MVKTIRDEVNTILFFDIAFDGNDGWFCNLIYPALFHVDITTGKTELLKLFTEIDHHTYGAFGGIAYVDGKLILAPKNTKQIVIYMIRSGDTEYISISDKYYNPETSHNLFQSIKVYGNWVYFFPGRYQAILKLNLDTYEIIYLDSWYKDIKDVIADETKLLFYMGFEEEHNWVFPFWQYGKILYFNYKEGNCLIEDIGTKDPLCWFEQIGQERYLIGFRERMALMFQEKGKKEVIEVPVPRDVIMERGILGIFKNKEEIYIVPVSGNRIIKTNMNFNVWEFDLKISMEYTSNHAFIGRRGDNFLGCKRIGEDLILLSPVYEGGMMLLDLSCGSLKHMHYNLSEKDVKLIGSHLKRYQYEKLKYETVDLPLDTFMKDISI